MKVFITGVAGFIGSHTAVSFLNDGMNVVGIDNLSRHGSTENLTWIEKHGKKFQFVLADIREANVIRQTFALHPDVDVIIHLAAQVAVTTSVINPREDFESNALGTLNLLEAVREYCPHVPFLYASTNKVYGNMENLNVIEFNGRYAYRNRTQGIGEDFPLDFHSPYGCSKGAADQYVRDYARIYGLKTVVFRQSCIYGIRQLGVEDQGWVAWFAIAATLGKLITIYGDGKQVRDVLWIDDLVALYRKAIDKIDIAAGQVYNIGGGPDCTLSLLELVNTLEAETGQRINLKVADWRPGDQRIFISDVTKARHELGWMPTVNPINGVKALINWTKASQDFLRSFFK